MYIVGCGWQRLVENVVLKFWSTKSKSPNDDNEDQNDGDNDNCYMYDDHALL